MGKGLCGRCGAGGAVRWNVVCFRAVDFGLFSGCGGLGGSGMESCDFELRRWEFVGFAGFLGVCGILLVFGRLGGIHGKHCGGVYLQGAACWSLLSESCVVFFVVFKIPWRRPR